MAGGQALSPLSRFPSPALETAAGISSGTLAETLMAQVAPPDVSAAVLGTTEEETVLTGRLELDEVGGTLTGFGVGGFGDTLDVVAA